MEEKKYLKWYNKIGYGSGDIAGNVVYAFLTSFVMVYLTDTIGLACVCKSAGMRRCLQKNTGRTSCLQKIFGVHIKKGPFHICEVVCFFSIQFSQIVLLARLCMIYMLKVSFIES